VIWCQLSSDVMALLAIRFQLQQIAHCCRGDYLANETVEAVPVALSGWPITRQLFQLRAYPGAARLPHLVGIAGLAYKVTFAHDIRVNDRSKGRCAKGSPPIGRRGRR